MRQHSLPPVSRGCFSHNDLKGELQTKKRFHGGVPKSGILYREYNTADVEIMLGTMRLLCYDTYIIVVLILCWTKVKFIIIPNYFCSCEVTSLASV